MKYLNYFYTLQFHHILKALKILLLMYNHFYKNTPEWKDWNTENFVFKLGTGYFVIYLESNNALNKLSEFIEYWKYVSKMILINTEMRIMLNLM